MRRSLVAWLAAGVASATTAGLSNAAPAPDLKATDVCALLRGAEVARTAGGALVSAKRFNAPDGKLARCVYLVGPSGEKETSAWVVELLPPGDFDSVRPYVEAPVTDVPSIGDGAYEHKDADSGRWRLYAHRRGGPTVSVTGADEALVRKIAALALARL